MPAASSPASSTWRDAPVAVAVALAAWALHFRPAQFATTTCATLRDGLAVVLARLIPSAPLGVWLLRADTALIVAAAALVAVAMRRWSGSSVAALAAGLAFAAHPLLAPTISAFDALPLLLAAMAFLSGARTAIALTLVAILPAGILLPALPPGFAPADAGCSLPFASSAAMGAWGHALMSFVSPTGLYAAALAVLGIYTLVSEGGARRRLAAWLAVFALAAAMAPRSAGQSPVTTFAPLIVAFWISATVGVREIVRACRVRRGGIVAAALFVAALPSFQIFAARAGAPSSPTYDVDRLSLRDLRRLAAVLPDRAALADDGEPVTATLLRALNGDWQQMGKHLAAEPGVRVFVFPLAQTRLQWLGVRLHGVQLPGIHGLAEIEPGPGCQRLRPRWIDASSLVAPDTHALSVVDLPPGDDNEAVIFVATREMPHPSPAGPRSGARPEFDAITFDRSIPSEMPRLAARLQADGAPPDFGASARFVTRLSVWRYAGASGVTSIDLAAAPGTSIARGAANSPPAGLVCPAYPYSPEALRIWQ